MKKIINLVKDESGAAGVEYGILVAAVSAGIIAVAFTIGADVLDAFTQVSDAFEAQNNPAP